MTTDLIDWNLERAAEELTWANRAQVRLSADPQQFADERETVDESTIARAAKVLFDVVKERALRELKEGAA